MSYLPLTSSYLPAAVLASLVATPLSYGAYRLFLFFYAQWTSPLHVLPGPPNASLLFGQMREIQKAVCLFCLALELDSRSLQENSVLHEKWVNEYGSTITYHVLFGVRFIGNIHDCILCYFQMKRLYTIDTKAINHVLVNDYIYQKPEAARYNLSQILGSGILVVEGDKHKQQVSLSIMFEPKKI